MKVAAGWHAPRVIQSAISTTWNIQGWPYSKVDKVLILRGNCCERGSAHAPLPLIIPMILIFLAGRCGQMLGRGRALPPSTLSQNTKLDTSRGCFVAKLHHAQCVVFETKNNHTWPFDSSLNERRARCVNDLSVKFSWIEKIGWIDDGDDCECINISKYIIFLIKFGLRII